MEMASQLTDDRLREKVDSLELELEASVGFHGSTVSQWRMTELRTPCDVISDVLSETAEKAK